MKCLQWIDRWGEEFAVSIMLSLLILLLGTEVFSRFLLGKSFSWIEELCRYLFVWASYLGVAIAVKHKEQLRILMLMDLLEKRFPRMVKACYIVSELSFAGSATVLVGVSMAFSRLLTLYHIPQSVGAFLASISTDPSITLLLIAFFIFLCGFVADTLAMVVVLAPVFLPITNSLGIHPIQLGVLFVVCCETGFLTPPFGANLFITMKITDIKLEQVAARAFPYLCTIWLLLFVIAVWPDFVMFLPRLLM